MFSVQCIVQSFSITPCVLLMKTIVNFDDYCVEDTRHNKERLEFIEDLFMSHVCHMMLKALCIVFALHLICLASLLQYWTELPLDCQCPSNCISGKKDLHIFTYLSFNTPGGGIFHLALQYFVAPSKQNGFEATCVVDDIWIIVLCFG